MTTSPGNSGMQCPLPLADFPRILLAHGGGGRLTNELIDKIFLSTFDNAELAARHDGAVLNGKPGKLAFTTDSYVVQPLFFPGGDIGSLAVNGTVNDLAMCGARPRYISAAFIIEEGFPVNDLWKIAQSMRRAADRAGVKIVTGDTKVVDRGKGDGVFITTAGIGVVEHEGTIGPAGVEPDDAVVLSGDIGRHGIAIMAHREGLSFESTIESDCAPLIEPALALLYGGIEVHCLRDLTRGGMATNLVELAAASSTHIQITETAIPVREDVRGACELLGLDPLYVANEGRFVAFVPAGSADRSVTILREHDQPAATVIGRVAEHGSGLVTMKSSIGSERIIDMLSGEQLPRIC